MSRPFSIVLILLGSTLLTGMVSWHFYTLDRAHKDLMEVSVSINERSTEVLELDVFYFIEGLRKEIIESENRYYQPLLQLLEGLQTEIRTYGDSIDTFQSSQELIEHTQLVLVGLIAAQALFLHEHAEYLELNEWMLEDRLGKLEEIGAIAPFGRTAPLLKTDAPIAYASLVGMIREHFLLSCHGLVVEANNLVSRPCYFDVDFPIFLEPVGTVTAGNQATAHLAVGTYSRSYAPDNVRFLIDGKEYGVGDDGILRYDFVAKGSGEKQLKVELRMTNPLTGEVRSSETSHSYTVR